MVHYESLMTEKSGPLRCFTIRITILHYHIYNLNDSRSIMQWIKRPLAFDEREIRPLKYFTIRTTIHHYSIHSLNDSCLLLIMRWKGNTIDLCLCIVILNEKKFNGKEFRTSQSLHYYPFLALTIHVQLCVWWKKLLVFVLRPAYQSFT